MDNGGEQPAEGQVPATTSIGRMLRLAREARGESLADAAYALKLTQSQVDAMERERFDLLPGPAFVRGFLRNYARHLGVDIEPQMAGGGVPSTASAATVELSPPMNATGTLPSGSRSRRAPRTALALIAVLVGVLVAGWYFDWFQVAEVESGAEGQPVAVVPANGVQRPVFQSQLMPPAQEGALPQPLSQGRGAAMTRNASGGGAEGQDATAAADEGVLAEVAGVADEAGAGAGATRNAQGESGPDENVPAPAQADAANAGDAAGAQVSPVAPVAPAVPETETGRRGTLVFRLAGESWIQVRDAGGATLYMGTGAPGTTRTVQGQPPFAVVVGNAEQVTLEHAGQQVDLKPYIRTGVARLSVE